MTDNNNVEGLVSDPGFRNWVLSPDDMSNRYWNNLAKQDPGKIELIKKARLVVLGLNQPEADLSNNEESILWDRIQSSIHEQEETNKRTRTFDRLYQRENNRKSSIGKWWYMAAASIAVVMAVWIGITQTTLEEIDQEVPISLIEKSVPNGQKLKMYLPDGSKVALNAGSKIVYPDSFNEEVRKVKLEGEAYFEVKEDPSKPFIVESKDLITEVLGTTFNVHSYPNAPNSSVALIEGKVKVKQLNKESDPNENSFITILPGEQIKYDIASNKLTRGKIENRNELMWMDGVLAFNDENIATVFNKLEKWYGVKIICEDMPRDKVLTGKFVNEYLDNVLVSINYTTKFDYRIDGDTVYMDFKN